MLRINGTTVITDTSFNNTQLLNYIKSANVFEVHTHGSATSLMAVNGSQVTMLEKSAIDGLSAGSLSSSKLVYLVACNTGQGGVSGSNLVNSIFSKGARCVIGQKDKVYTLYSRIMLENFNLAIGYGYTIQNALAYADAQVLALKGKAGGTDNRLVRGDTSVKFAETSQVLSNLEQLPNKEIIYFMNEDGVYGYFDVSKISPIDETSTGYAFLNNQVQKAVVEEFIISKVVDFEKYTLNYCNYVEDTGLTTYVYSYYIDDINTDDHIFVMISNDNQIVAYGVPNEGKFNNINLDEIDWAQNTAYLGHVLQEKGISEYEILDECLVIENGVLSMRYTIAYNFLQFEYECFDEIIVTLEGR